LSYLFLYSIHLMLLALFMPRECSLPIFAHLEVRKVLELVKMKADL